jgi:hypothetical protein
VEGAQVFFVPDDPPTPPPPPVIPDPVVDPNPIIITDREVTGTPDPVGSLGAGTVVYTEDEATSTGVKFMLQVMDSSGGTSWVVFTDLPDALIGALYDSLGVAVIGDGNAPYDPSAETFEFRPAQYEPTCDVSPTFSNCYDNYPDANSGEAYEDPSLPDGYVAWSDTFSFIAQNSLGGESLEVTVTVTVVDDICATGSEGSRPGTASVTNCP